MKLTTILPYEIVKQSKKLRKLPVPNSTLSIADIIDNAESIFCSKKVCPFCGISLKKKRDKLCLCNCASVLSIVEVPFFEFMKIDILRQCMQDKPLEEISKYILDNIKATT